MNHDSKIHERATIRSRFTLVIPKKIREKLNLKEQDPVEVTIKGESILITPIKDNLFEKLERFGGDFEFNRENRIKAEEELLRQVKN